MKASLHDQNELLRLQAADTRVQQLEHASRSLPQRAELAVLAPQIDDVRQRAKARNDELEDTQIELARIESDVGVVEARIARDSARVAQTSSLKDVQGLEQELASLRKRRDDLEEIQLAVMEKIEEIEKAAAQLGLERRALDERVGALEGDIAVEQERFDAERLQLTQERAAVAEALPADLVALYERQRARYGVGAALLVRGVSMGSNVALTESDLSELRRAAADDVMLCPDSGAILIRNAESGL